MFPVLEASIAAQRASFALAVLIALNMPFAANSTAQETPAKRPQAVDVTRDIIYAAPEKVDLRCDIYTPFNRDASAAPPNKKFPAVIVIHGGAWSSGSKVMVANYATQLAQAGAVAMAIDYRHAPTYKFPTQLDDVRDAMVWLHDHAAEWNVDLERVGLFGYSAGGHLACLIATLADESPTRVLQTSQWRQDDDRWKRLPSIKAVVAGGPPCIFTNLPLQNRGLEFFLGGTREERPETYVAASPTSFASKDDCPICFIHGERDFIVPIESSRALFDAQISCGVNSKFVVIEKQGHLVTFLHPKTSETLRDYMSEVLELTR
jgi:acetyl esterase/lipase